MSSTKEISRRSYSSNHSRRLGQLRNLYPQEDHHHQILIPSHIPGTRMRSPINRMYKRADYPEFLFRTFSPTAAEDEGPDSDSEFCSKRVHLEKLGKLQQVRLENNNQKPEIRVQNNSQIIGDPVKKTNGRTTLPLSSNDRKNKESSLLKSDSSPCPVESLLNALRERRKQAELHNASNPVTLSLDKIPDSLNATARNIAASSNQTSPHQKVENTTISRARSMIAQNRTARIPRRPPSSTQNQIPKRYSMKGPVNQSKPSSARPATSQPTTTTIADPSSQDFKFYAYRDRVNTFVRAVENKINEVKTQHRNRTGTPSTPAGFNQFGTLSLLDSRLSNVFIKEPARLGVVGQKIRRRPNSTPGSVTYFHPSSFGTTVIPRRPVDFDIGPTATPPGDELTHRDPSNTPFRTPSPNKSVRAVRFNFSDSSIHEYQANDPIHVQTASAK